MKYVDPKGFDTLLAEAQELFKRIATDPQPRPPVLIREGARYYTMSTPEEDPMEKEIATSTLAEEALLLEIVRSVVRHPERVTISTTHGKEISVHTISVDPQDVSHVIGKEHRTIAAVRHLFAKSATMNGRKAIINLDLQPELNP